MRSRCPCLSLCQWPPLLPLPNPPCSSLWPAALQHSALLHFAQLRSRKATSSLPSSSPTPPAVTTHRSQPRGRGDPRAGHTAPGPQSPAGRTVARSDAGPQSPEVGSVPGSLTASSRSVPARDVATTGSLRPVEPTPGPSSQTSGPKVGFTPGIPQAGRPVGRGHSSVHRLAQVWGLSGEVPGWGPALALLTEASQGTPGTGHGELKLESGEWEAADKAISQALHRAPVSSFCSLNPILRASLPPPSPCGGASALRPAV